MKHIIEFNTIAELKSKLDILEKFSNLYQNMLGEHLNFLQVNFKAVSYGVYGSVIIDTEELKAKGLEMSNIQSDELKGMLEGFNKALGITVIDE